MSPEGSFFAACAFVGLLLLARYELRISGVRAGLKLLGYLAALAVVRELSVYVLSRYLHEPLPYSSAGRMGSIGPVNLVVASGWVYVTLCSFHLAKLIQRRSFPGTSIYLTLALTALVTTAVSYAVETTGARVGLWQWRETGPSSTVSWLPFLWPFDAFEGWAATSFMLMAIFCGVRHRLFAATRLRNLALVAVLIVSVPAANLAQGLFGHMSPRKVLTGILIAAAVVLGFAAPRGLRGTSDAEVAGDRRA